MSKITKKRKRGVRGAAASRVCFHAANSCFSLSCRLVLQGNMVPVIWPLPLPWKITAIPGLEKECAPKWINVHGAPAQPEPSQSGHKCMAHQSTLPCVVSEIFNLYSFENNSPSTIMILLNFVFQVNVFDIKTIY